ncbi:MAG: tetratricopeptide repeat protein [Candidatus Taylorbacteria bacterium]|nr:tetratricopeptide repeat protein [Candidatus Taylorbacteria bacterium]
MVWKPAGLNQTDAWSTEFSTGFGLLPTMIAAEGIVGTTLWILLLVFLGIAIARSLKSLPEDPYSRFVTVSSSISSIFLWIVAILYVPSQAMFFMAFLMAGIFAAAAVSNGILSVKKIAPVSSIMKNIIMPALFVICIIIAVLWALIYVKKTIALVYFSSGVRSLTVGQDFKAADLAFNTALSFDKSDVYWEALSENYRLNINQLISTATSSSPALVTKVTDMINSGVSAARSAIAYDPSNYYNYLSEARISQLAVSIKTANAYENAVQAYTNAINLDPTNPALYVNLAQLQADNSKLDDALKTLGTAIQVKSNYLDAVFLISQVQAAKGDLPNAIVAAQIATQINSNSAVLYFQLGLLQYNAKNYQPAVDALSKAVSIQPDYANARYFLGLSEARVNDIAGAIAQFEELSKTNPDSKEIALILNNLRAGKSPFTDAKPPVTATPEKRAALPVKER